MGQQTREMVVKKVLESILALNKHKNPFLRRIYLKPVRHND